MMDFHTHLLPEMDDGSRSVEESLAMLKQMAAQNINWAAATPHFYAFQESPEQFLERRSASAAQLQKEMSQWKDLPRISLGAEVRYYEASAGQRRSVR